MKKLDNKMLKEKEGEQNKVDSDVVDATITCECCSETPTIQPVMTRKEGENDEYDDEEHVHSGNQKKKQLLGFNKNLKV